jgi:hypothetical protein
MIMEIGPIVFSSASMLPPALRCVAPESSEPHEDDLIELPPHEEEEAGWGACGWEVFRDIDY